VLFFVTGVESWHTRNTAWVIADSEVARVTDVGIRND